MVKKKDIILSRKIETKIRKIEIKIWVKNPSKKAIRNDWTWEWLFSGLQWGYNIYIYLPRFRAI